VAADGDGKNGLYTEELLEALREPGLKVEEVFNVTTAAVSAPTAAAPDREGLFWMSIKDGTDPAAFEAYLREEPSRVGRGAPVRRALDGDVPGAVEAREIRHPGRLAHAVQPLAGERGERPLGILLWRWRRSWATSGSRAS
jgi:hypothetical protein